jgi:hypothetical protein
VIGIYHNVPTIHPVGLPSEVLLAVKLATHDKFVAVEYIAKLRAGVGWMLNSDLMHSVSLCAGHIHS